MQRHVWKIALAVCLLAWLAACSADGNLQTGSAQQEDSGDGDIDLALDGEGRSDTPEGTVRLDVFLDGAGGGAVTSAPAGIDCNPDCTANFEAGAEVTLTASPDSGSSFDGWSGGCSGTDLSCTLTLTQNVSVRARFACQPNCSGRECGNDNCGDTCGSCGNDQFCDQSGSCVDDCTVDCSGRQCGNDGCGGSCGSCASGQRCTQQGSCVDDCTPSCSGRECGGDGCGGSCGSCPSSQMCDAAGICGCKDGEVDDAGVCDFWILDEGDFQWKGYNLDSVGGADAPTATIRAAFDIEHEDRAFVLTGNSAHEFRPSDRRWLAAQPLSFIDSGLTSTNLGWADSVPSSHPGGTPGGPEGATIAGLTGGQKYVWQKTYDPATGTFSDTSGGLHGEPHDWTDANAPVPSQIRSSWLDVDNARGWIDGDPSQMCGAGHTQVGPYGAKFTSSHVHVIELGLCFEFFDPIPVGDFEPMKYTGAPPVNRIGASFWHQGALFVFGGN